MDGWWGISRANLYGPPCRKFVLGNKFDFFIVHQGRSIKYTDDISPSLCLPKKTRDIDYNAPGYYQSRKQNKKM